VLTLWDLLEPVAQRLNLRPQPPAPPPPRPARITAQPAPRSRPRATRRPESSMQARYDAVVREMLDRYGVRVRKWRTSMSGVAWTVTYADGRVARLIEAPRPRGPMSAAVFLHEIGHHAIGLGAYRPRCLEEYHAWAWALAQMEAHGLNITDAVRQRMHASLHYAIAKALRRGLRDLPPELVPFAERPPRRRRARATPS
jgi:hypothetical protein